MNKALIVATDSKIAEAISFSLGESYRTNTVCNKEQAYAYYAEVKPSVIFIDINLLVDGELEPDNLSSIVACFKDKTPGAELIVLTPPEMLRPAIKAVRAGAADLLTCPISSAEVTIILDEIAKSRQMRGELQILREELFYDMPKGISQSRSRAVIEVYEKLKAVAAGNTTVLLTGETGTGKTSLSIMIHQYSTRQARPFVPIYCGAIPETLIESELFGHERGSFTGAERRKLGRFEIARGGTILLDEIATLSPSVQVKLLHVLQNKIFSRVGGTDEIEADVRIIAASNEDLEKMCDEGKFRKDLYYRLNVFPIQIPPLRERKEDIPLIVEQILTRLNAQYNKGISELEPVVLESFEQYCWPGNIRELENVIERAYIIAKSNVLTGDLFPVGIIKGQAAVIIPPETNGIAEVRRRAIEQVEKNYLCELLTLHRGKVSAVAEQAGITDRQIRTLLTKHKLCKKDFRQSHPKTEA